MNKKKVILISSTIITIIILVICFIIFKISPYDLYGGDQCPKCKSTNVGTFFYGEYDPEFEDSITLVKVEEGVLIPGGCVIDYDSPKYRCNDCSFMWGKYWQILIVFSRHTRLVYFCGKSTAYVWKDANQRLLVHLYSPSSSTSS